MQTKYTTSVCWTFCISLCPPFIKSLQPWIHILQDKFRVLCLSFHLTQWYWIELLCYEIVSYSAALVPRVLPFFKPINFSDISKKLYMISAFSHLLLKGLTFVRCILQGAGENCFHLECDNFSLHSPLNVNYQVLTTCYWFWPEGYRFDSRQLTPQTAEIWHSTEFICCAHAILISIAILMFFFA